MQASDENKEKYQSWDYQWIQYQILQTNIMRIIWQTVKRITNEILGVSELEWLWKNYFTFMLLLSLWTCGWFTHTGMIFFLLSFFKAIQASFLFLFTSLNICSYGILKNCVSVQMNMMRKLSKCSLWPKVCFFTLSNRKISLTVWILIKVNHRCLWVFILTNQFLIFFLLCAPMAMTKKLNKFQIETNNPKLCS